MGETTDIKARRAMTEVALIGAGKVARKHLAAYRHLDVDVTVTDIDERKAHATADEFGAEWWSGPPQRLMQQADAVDICTPVDTHYDLIMAALEADRPVFCEKPLAASTEEAELIRNTALENDQHVQAGYLYRYHPAFQLVKEVLEDNIIGEPYYGIFRVGGRGSASAWKHTGSRGGGAANEMLVHMVDLALWYFDDLTATSIYKDLLRPQREIGGQTVDATAEDAIAAKGITPSGAHVLLEADLVTPSYMNHIEINGTNGTVWASLRDELPTLVYCEERRGLYEQGMNTRTFDRVDLFRRELVAFEDRVHNARPPDFASLDDAVQTTAIIEEVRDG